jgi:crotonobetainyl-CoA:carnitine CoA-transferase CaiB-like acyl-CoA transferase
MDAVPELGQHTDSILRELGKTKLQINEMRLRNAI